MRRRKRTTSFRFQTFSVKQKKLLMWWTDNSPYRDYDMVIAEGAIRSGKTIAMVDSFVTWSLAKHRHQNFIVAGKSMGALKRNVLEPMFQILTAKGFDYHYHRSENPHVIIGTNTYYLFGANNESSQDTLQGLTAAGAYLDEVALFPESFVTQALGRCSAQTGNQGAKVFVNCNPEGPYHWFKTEYIDQAKAKQIFVLHFTLEDNLSLADSVKQRYHRMFSGVFYRRYILGLWVMAEGVVYDMFDEEQHVIDNLPDTFERLFVGGDFGMNNPTSFLLLGQKGKNFYVIREYYHASGKPSETEQSQQKTLGQYTDDFIQFLADDRPEVVYLDPSALALIRELRARGYTNIKAADNTVNEGIQLVQNLLSGHEGQLFIHRSCEHLIREFCSYTWDPKAQERGEDAVIKENDHALDALRYALFNMWHALRKTSARKERLRGGKGGTYL